MTILRYIIQIPNRKNIPSLLARYPSCNGYLMNLISTYFLDSKYIGNIWHSDDLVQAVTISCITYSYMTTQNLNILHPYRRKSIRKDAPELRYYCAFNATYQSSPRKMTHYFNSRKPRFSWLSTFRQRKRKDMLHPYRRTIIRKDIPRCSSRV